MNKRDFIIGASAAAWPATGAAQRRTEPAPAAAMQVLTIAGRISRSTRGPVDPVHDQLMKRHGIRFRRAYAFGVAQLLGLPVQSVQPTLEYDGKVHALRGPALLDVLDAAGANLREPLQVGVRALDGYVANLSLAQVRERAMILATHLDDKPLSIGGLGPLWAVFDPAAVADLRDKPLPQRFAQCPWGVYFIEVA